MNLNWNDINPNWMREPTHFAPSVLSAANFRFEAPKPATLTGKWCSHCAKDTHQDADCWSTRAVP